MSGFPDRRQDRRLPVSLTILLIILGAGLSLRHGTRREAAEQRKKAGVLGARNQAGDGRIS
jgi:hypothetical protein